MLYNLGGRDEGIGRDSQKRRYEVTIAVGAEEGMDSDGLEDKEFYYKRRILWYIAD